VRGGATALGCTTSVGGGSDAEAHGSYGAAYAHDALERGRDGTTRRHQRVSLNCV
jgi:hypothetical protein